MPRKISDRRQLRRAVGRRRRGGNESQPSSKFHAIEGWWIFDFGRILVERLPGIWKLQQRPSPNWLYNQAIPFFAEKSFVAGQLKVARNPQSLIPPAPEQPHDPFGLHSVLPAVKAAYVETYASTVCGGGRPATLPEATGFSQSSPRREVRVVQAVGRRQWSSSTPAEQMKKEATPAEPPESSSS
jgi:hypothetical protein